MNKSAFRPQAVNRHVDSDLEGGLLRSAPRATLVIWAGLTLVFLVAIGIAAVTRVHVHAEGRGIVRPEGGVVVVRAGHAGRIREVRIKDGAKVQAGDTLFVLEDPDETVTAPHAGIVDDVGADVGARAQAGDALASIVPDDVRLVGYVAMPERDRASLVPGQKMRIRVDAFPYQEFGLGEGKVVGVSPDLVSSKWAVQLRAAGIEPTGAVLAEVELTKLPPKATGLRAGMLFTGEVIVRDQRVATLLFRPLAGVLAD